MILLNILAMRRSKQKVLAHVRYYIYVADKGMCSVIRNLYQFGGKYSENIMADAINILLKCILKMAEKCPQLNYMHVTLSIHNGQELIRNTVKDDT